MLERFAKPVREIVRKAERDARALVAPAVGSEHLLLALVELHPFLFALDRFGPPACVAPGVSPRGAVFVMHELPDDAGALRRLIERDAAEALATLGISLADVRGRIEAEFGESAWDESGGDRQLPFNREAKEALELSLRVALETRTRRIGPCELAIALLRQGGRARALVAEIGLDPDAVETRLVGVTSEIVSLAGR